jgi:hypothetical protein
VPLYKHKVLSSSPVQPKLKKIIIIIIIIIIFGAEEIDQWENVCPACAKPLVHFPSITKKIKNGKEDKWH